jgi:hypothetical protein
VYDLRPELVVVDSLSSISMRGENNVEDVRSVLGFLGAVAREFDLGLLLIHHLRKRGKATPMMDLVTADDFRGSTHIIAMARSVLALSIIQEGAEPDRNGPRRLEVVKTNLCRYPPALGVRFEEGGGEGDQRGDHPSTALGTGSGSPVPWLVYGETPREYREPTQAEVCAAWLVEVLEEAGEQDHLAAGGPAQVHRPALALRRVGTDLVIGVGRSPAKVPKQGQRRILKGTFGIGVGVGHSLNPSPPPPVKTPRHVAL